MSQFLQAARICDLRQILESNVYIKNDGYHYIKIAKHNSDKPEEFLYLGFTKAGNPKFGHNIPNKMKIQKRIGKIDEKGLRIMGGVYAKSMEELMEDSFQ